MKTNQQDKQIVKTFPGEKAYFIAIILFQQTLGALTYPIAKYGLAKIEPFTFAFYRFLIAAIVLLTVVKFQTQTVKIEKKDYKRIIGMGCMIIIFNQTAYLFGQKLTGAGHAALLYATVPIWIFIGGLLYLKEKFVLRRAIGVILGMIGVILIIASGAVELGTQYLIGDLIIMVAVIAWAVYTFMGRPLVVKYGAIRTTAYALASGTVLYFPFGIFRALTFDYSKTDLMSWLSVLYVALGVSIGAYVLWYWLLKYIETTRIAVYQNFQPVIATAATFFLLGEKIGWPFIIGGSIVLIGVIITRR